MKVLVLGGTGAMGAYLVNLLADKASRVVVTSRTRTGHEGVVEYVTGNARSEVFIKDLLKQHWDVIIDFMVYTTQSFSERYKYLLSSTDQYVYLSSSRVYANSERPITENSPRLLDVSDDKTYLSTDEYALAKARQENLLFDSPQKNWSIIRPYISYSDGRLQLGVLEKEDWLYRALQGRSIVTSKDIQSKRTTLTHGLDVARGICALLGQPRALGEAFHITSSSTISWCEVLETYLNVLESHLKYRPSVTLQELECFMQWRSAKYQIIYDRLFDRQFNNSKIGRYVDTASFVAPEIGLTQSLESFISTKTLRFNAINWRAEGIKDRLLGEKTPIASISGLKQKAKYCFSQFSSLI